MNKPNWNKAPEWAEWWACDYNGDSYWYEHEPFPQTKSWINNKGNFVLDSGGPQNNNWRDSLTTPYRVATPEESKAVDDALQIELVNLRLDKKTLARFDKIAELTGFNRIAVIRKAIEHFLKDF